jgi:hypothetical protein
VAKSIDTLSKTGIDVRFRWSPGYEGVVGNEEANNVAYEASSRGGRLIALVGSDGHPNPSENRPL